MRKKIYKEGTSALSIVQDGWSRGFHPRQTVVELVLQFWDDPNGCSGFEKLVTELFQQHECSMENDIGSGNKESGPANGG